MVPQWKRWIGAAAVLLLVGAGCKANVQPEASVDAGAGATGETEDDGTMQVDVSASSSVDAEIDAAVDAALGESDADAATEIEGNSDADVMNNDSAELNAYGQTYVESEIK
jgi:hypothetical protein